MDRIINFRNKELIFVLGFTIALALFLFGRMVFFQIQARVPSEAAGKSEAPIVNPFASVGIKAQAAFVFDMAKNKPIFALNEHAQLPLASLTKIMTALLAVEKIGEGGVAVVNKEAISKEGDHGFFVNEKWRIKDLIDATLLSSSNDGAYALASVFAIQENNTSSLRESALAHAMNEKVAQLGLQQTFFTNEAGLDVNSGVSGAYGSAHDMAKILEYVLAQHPTLMEATTHALLTVKSIDGKVHNLENTNKFVETLPGIVASKTGTTDLAGGNLAIVFEAGPMRPIVIVILGSTAEDRFTDVKKLIWASLEYLQKY